MKERKMPYFLKNLSKKFFHFSTLVFIGLVILSATGWFIVRGFGRAPNIILIVSDTHRADYLGVYGFDKKISPHIDEFAKDSIVFENAISPSPWTMPSIATLLSSLSPSVHGVLEFQKNFLKDFKQGKAPKVGTLSQNIETFPETLKKSVILQPL